MTLSTTNYGNNSFAPGITADVFIPDQLIAGDMKIVTDTKTITGGAAYKRGTVLGRVADGTAVVTVKASGANTGNGTFVIDATTPILPAGESGLYKLRMTSATNARLTDGKGRVLGDIAIVATNGDTANVADQIKGVLTEGSTVFVAGDGFDIAVVVSDDLYTPATAAATDGSDRPVVILVDDVDTTGGNVTGGIYRQGEFNGNALTLGAGITLAAATNALLAGNIYIKTPVSAADPS